MQHVQHIVVAVPIEKLDCDGVVAFRFACSCGRVGNGWHDTHEQAIKAGQDHIPPLPDTTEETVEGEKPDFFPDMDDEEVERITTSFVERMRAFRERIRRNTV